MPDLNASPGQLRLTIEITRKETGKIETYELIGKVKGHGGNSLDSGAERRN